MQAATSTMRAGLYAQQILGIGLNATDRQTLRDWQDRTEALAQAIGEAISAARLGGLDAFAPDSATLSASLQATGLTSAELRKLFAEVVGHPYSAADAAADQALYPGLPDHGALTLAQWSQAVQALQVEVACQGSMLPPVEGGGLRHALGQWYVNGERYTLAELFLTVRMGNLTETDKALETDLNTMLANTNLARELLVVLAEMKRLRGQREAAVVPPATEPVFNARTDFQAAVEATKVTLSELMDYGSRFKGDGSYLQSSGASALASATSTITSADYGYTMDELQALFDSVNAENQVKRLQVQSVQNARMAVLEGMSNFMSGQLLTNQTVGRNL
jgi:hypothetical protein